MFDHKDNTAWIQEEVDRTNNHKDGIPVHSNGSHSQVAFHMAEHRRIP
jgi:hypothetical protein